MKPFYWQGTRNFGDYMNEWLWSELLGELLHDDGVRLIGIGSLLKSSLNYLEGTKVIFGSGAGYGAMPAREAYADWRFYFVRGPLTAKCFDLPAEKAIVDGAWLISQIPSYQKIPSKSGVCFIPHWTSAESGCWKKVCEQAGIQYLSPYDDVHDIFKTIAGCEKVVTESLHGAIIADYFRTGWIPVGISPKFLPFKWADWCRSIEVPAKYIRVPQSDWFEYLYTGADRRKIDYRISADEIDYNEQSLASESYKGEREVNLMYKIKIQAKTKARNVRRGLLDGSKAIRDNVFVKGWNAGHQEKLAGMLEEVTRRPAFMSDDRVREQKIEQLDAVLHQLRNDFSVN